jgi:ABC-type transporter Mla maintaining outer membrane lipid asymmetry ATPase subunit MlaF
MTADMNAATENLVEISGVEFSYGPRKLLKGLNLKIPRSWAQAARGSRRCSG